MLDRQLLPDRVRRGDSLAPEGRRGRRLRHDRANTDDGNGL
jgi:hypothetical protein